MQKRDHESGELPLLGPLGRIFLREQVTAQEFKAWLESKSDEICEAIGIELFAELVSVGTESRNWHSDVRMALADHPSAQIRERVIEAGLTALQLQTQTDVMYALLSVAKHGAGAKGELCDLYRWYCDGASVLEPIAMTWGLHCTLVRDEVQTPNHLQRDWPPPSVDARSAAREVLDVVAARSLSFRVDPAAELGSRIQVVEAGG